MIIPSLKALFFAGLALVPVTPDSLDQERPSDSQSVSFEIVPVIEATASVDSLISISIDTVEISEFNAPTVDTLDLRLRCENVRFAGLSLRIAIDVRYYDIVAIFSGEMIDSCRWQMFTARPVARTALDSVYSVWQITALANAPSGGKFTGLYGYDGEGSIARVVISREHTENLPTAGVPLFFIWSGCADNLISSKNGKVILVSDSVVHSIPTGLSASGDDFPTTEGTPQSCINPRVPNKPRRVVQFHSGGLIFRSTVD